MTISPDKVTAISNFMAAAAHLRLLGVIRSDRFLGDIGEFLAAAEYGLKLAKSGRQVGHDTEGDTDRVQIKFHNSVTRTNINVGDPSQYDRLLIVLGPESRLHPGGVHVGKYCFYEFTALIVEQCFKTNKGFYCAKVALSEPDRALSLSSIVSASTGSQP